MSNRKPLTELQQAIVDFVWRAGGATAEQVREGLAPKHQLKDSTVRTLLRRLEEREYVSHRVEGKVFVYEAAAGPRSLAARSVRQIIERFWSGSAEQFLAGMVDEKVLTAAQIRRLADKIKANK
jgi:predicted transcriptional regulator